MMTPVLRRTWGRRGVTPTLAVRARTHEKVSGLGALLVSPRRRQLSLALALHVKANIRGPQVRRFLAHLHRHFPGPVVLLWDRGQPHRHHLVRQWLAAHPSWHAVWFPPYAPELNPTEPLWRYLTYGRLANFAPHDVEQIPPEVRLELQRLRRRPTLLRSFFRHSALPFRVSHRTLFIQ
jgi:transposase